ncbi:hypothetical protein LINPERHAP1_LOCUS29949 [Linum perenne]
MGWHFLTASLLKIWCFLAKLLQFKLGLSQTFWIGSVRHRVKAITNPNHGFTS